MHNPELVQIFRRQDKARQWMPRIRYRHRGPIYRALGWHKGCRGPIYRALGWGRIKCEDPRSVKMSRRLWYRHGGGKPCHYIIRLKEKIVVVKASPCQLFIPVCSTSRYSDDVQVIAKTHRMARPLQLVNEVALTILRINT